MDYEDFEVKIDSEGDHRYVVHVLRSPVGQASGILASPEGPAPAGWHSEQPAARRDLDLPTNVSASGLSPREIGNALFEALFSGDIRDLYHQSLGAVSAAPGCGLRLKLHFSLLRPDLVQISSLPWEVLYRSSTKEFLSLNRATPVVRYLDVPQAVHALSLPPPLRALVLLASPTDLPPLDLAGEVSGLIAAVEGHPQLDLRFVARATKRDLRDLLLAEPFHVLHFIGHGAFDEVTGLGQLVLENAAGTSDAMTGEELCVHLRQATSMRLAFLNGCSTARATRRDGLDPFAGVATALVHGGMPAVIAMQFPISDAAAIAFSGAFYQRIAISMPIDTAVAEARIALYSCDPDSHEWATPVLFMRAPDGKLFDFSRISAEEKREAQRLAAACNDDQLEAFERSFASPVTDVPHGSPTLSGLELAQRRIEHASVQGGDAWIQLSEALLSCVSPLQPFAGVFQAGRPGLPHGAWSYESGDVLGRGTGGPALLSAPGSALAPDLSALSVLPWQGLRFRDGALGASLWWPNLGGGGGLVLRHVPTRSALLGLLRLGDDGVVMAEIWQQESDDFVLIAARPLPELSPNGWYEVALDLAGRRANWRVGATAVVGQLATDIAPGHAGLAAAGGSTVRYRNSRIAVHRRDEPELPFKPRR